MTALGCLASWRLALRVGPQKTGMISLCRDDVLPIRGRCREGRLGMGFALLVMTLKLRLETALAGGASIAKGWQARQKGSRAAALIASCRQNVMG